MFQLWEEIWRISEATTWVPRLGTLGTHSGKYVKLRIKWLPYILYMYVWQYKSWIRIHKRTISLGFFGIILKVWLKVCVYNVYITNQFQTTFARGEGSGVNVNVRGDRGWIARRKTYKTFVPITSKNSASGLYSCSEIVTCWGILEKIEYSTNK